MKRIEEVQADNDRIETAKAAVNKNIMSHPKSRKKEIIVL